MAHWNRYPGTRLWYWVPDNTMEKDGIPGEQWVARPENKNQRSVYYALILESRKISNEQITREINSVRMSTEQVAASTRAYEMQNTLANAFQASSRENAAAVAGALKDVAIQTVQGAIQGTIAGAPNGSGGSTGGLGIGGTLAIAAVIGLFIYMKLR